MENREEVERICRAAVHTHNELVNARSNEQNLRRLYDYQIAGIRELERQAREYAGQIFRLGYHDIGHARTVLGRDQANSTAAPDAAGNQEQAGRERVLSGSGSGAVQGADKV